MEFDRKDINMNKLVATSLEGTFHVYDLRTQHPTKGFSSVSEKVGPGPSLVVSSASGPVEIGLSLVVSSASGPVEIGPSLVPSTPTSCWTV